MLFNLASTLSLLLLVGSAMFWVRSKFIYDEINFSSANASWYGHIEDGRIVAFGLAGGDSHYSWKPKWRDPPVYARNAGLTTASSTGSAVARAGSVSVLGHASYTIAFDSSVSFPGFSFGRRGNSPFASMVTVQFWLITLLSAILPGLRMVEWFNRGRRLRVASSYCASCGYDLRATPDRCPECGLVTSTAQ